MSAYSKQSDYGNLPGKLFIVEGIDGSGKSTQLDLLTKWLRSQGFCAYFSEWNSSPLVRETTKQGKQRRLLTPITFSLIHAADFADRFERTILPPLRAGAIVLADRYVYTAYARDAARGVDRDYIRRMYSFAPKPTGAFFFDVPLPEALKRILSGRPQLKWYEAGMDLNLSEDPYKSFEMFQGRIREEYLRIVEECGLSVIDATLPISEQQARLRDQVRPHLDGMLRVPTIPYGELAAEGVTGRYISEISGDWRHE
jgi:dTMP kinase